MESVPHLAASSTRSQHRPKPTPQARGPKYRHRPTSPIASYLSLRHAFRFGRLPSPRSRGGNSFSIARAIWGNCLRDLGKRCPLATNPSHTKYRRLARSGSPIICFNTSILLLSARLTRCATMTGTVDRRVPGFGRLWDLARQVPSSVFGSSVTWPRADYAFLRYSSQFAVHLFFPADKLWATAERTRSLKAGASILLPSLKSMARVFLASRPALNIPFGSFRDAPLKKLSFT
jgi:hypothetical protein